MSASDTACIGSAAVWGGPSIAGWGGEVPNSELSLTLKVLVLCAVLAWSTLAMFCRSSAPTSIVKQDHRAQSQPLFRSGKPALSLALAIPVALRSAVRHLRPAARASGASVSASVSTTSALSGVAHNLGWAVRHTVLVPLLPIFAAMAALMLLTCLLVFVLLVTFALVAAVTDLVSAITDAERRQHIEPLQPLWHKYPVLLSLPVPRFRVANADNEL